MFSFLLINYSFTGIEENEVKIGETPKISQKEAIILLFLRVFVETAHIFAPFLHSDLVGNVGFLHLLENRQINPQNSKSKSARDWHSSILTKNRASCPPRKVYPRHNARYLVSSAPVQDRSGLFLQISRRWGPKSRVSQVQVRAFAWKYTINTGHQRVGLPLPWRLPKVSLQKQNRLRKPTKVF